MIENSLTACRDAITFQERQKKEKEKYDEEGIARCQEKHTKTMKVKTKKRKEKKTHFCSEACAQKNFPLPFWTCHESLLIPQNQ